MSDHQLSLAEGDEAEKRRDFATAITASRRRSTAEFPAPAATRLFRPVSVPRGAAGAAPTTGRSPRPLNCTASRF